MKNKFNDQCITLSQMNLIFNMRIFWRRLTIWTRTYIISRYLGIGTAEVAFDRLYLENLNFGDLLRVVFSRGTAEQYSRLLNQFSIGLRELISSQIENDADAIRRNIDSLVANANERAEFLASINPYFNEAEWRDLLIRYLEYTMEEANLYASKDYRMDIEYFDRLAALSNTMGDVFAQAWFDYITSGAQNENISPDERCLTYEQINLIYDIRMFWFDLNNWTRAFMLSRYRDVGDEDEVYARLQQVIADFINNLNSFFGEDAETELLRLRLTAYIGLIDSLITAQKAGNTEEADRITRLLYQNANDRATAIASLNPYWDETEWKTRIYNNVRNSIDESTTFLTQDYARNLDIFSRLMDQSENMSEYFADGLLNYMFHEPQQQQEQEQEQQPQPQPQPQ
ncbi:MAG TPA: hypothetical protein PKA19_14465 [Bacillota bacterium]|nr:hypothetical protein [Bacillota bacterium]